MVGRKTRLDHDPHRTGLPTSDLKKKKKKTLYKRKNNSYLLLTNDKKAPTYLLHNIVLFAVEPTPTEPAQIPIIVLVTTRPKHTQHVSLHPHATKRAFILGGLVPKCETIGMQTITKPNHSVVFQLMVSKKRRRQKL